MNKKREYNKKHYKTFKVDLKIVECDELEELLKEDNKSKAQFLRNAIEDYKFMKQYKIERK